LVFTTHEDAPLNLKITDFGTSKASVGVVQKGGDIYAAYEAFPTTQKKQEKVSSKGVGTLVYQAPEILEGSTSFDDKQIDVFSFGILLWQIFTQKFPYSIPPYSNYDSREIASFVRAGKRLEIPKDMPREIIALIQSCWDQNPSDRPDFSHSIVPLLTKTHENLLKKVKPSPVPAPLPVVTNSQIPKPPDKDLNAIGWCSDISRLDTEAKLAGTAKGTYLVRWSPNQNCFVLSYHGADKMKHIDSIWLNSAGKIEVLRTDGSRPTFETMMDYIVTLRDTEHLVTHPVRLAPTEQQYEQPPNFYHKSPFADQKSS